MPTKAVKSITKLRSTNKKSSLPSKSFNFKSPLALAIIALVALAGGVLVYRSFAAGYGVHTLRWNSPGVGHEGNAGNVQQGPVAHHYYKNGYGGPIEQTTAWAVDILPGRVSTSKDFHAWYGPHANTAFGSTRGCVRYAFWYNYKPDGSGAFGYHEPSIKFDITSKHASHVWAIQQSILKVDAVSPGSAAIPTHLVCLDGSWPSTGSLSGDKIELGDKEIRATIVDYNSIRISSPGVLHFDVLRTSLHY